MVIFKNCLGRFASRLVHTWAERIWSKQRSQ